MSIDSKCVGCNKILRVGDEHAGKQAKCPECGAVTQIAELGNLGVSADGNKESLHPTDRLDSQSTPGEQNQDTQDFQLPFTPSQMSDGQEIGETVPGNPESTNLFIRLADGAVYGPANSDSLQRWFAEGRIQAESVVMDGNRTLGTYAEFLGQVNASKRVNPLQELFDSSQSGNRETSSAANAAFNPYANSETASQSTEKNPPSNPYGSTQSPHPPGRGINEARSGAGIAVLILGLSSMVLCVPCICQICAILAITLGGIEIATYSNAPRKPDHFSATIVGVAFGALSLLLVVGWVAATILLN
jgi:hypothetical protein